MDAALTRSRRLTLELRQPVKHGRFPLKKVKAMHS